MDSSNSPPRLVFVDDEPSVLSALQRIFFDKDYVIKTFTSPEAALTEIPLIEPDIIVSDQIMPEMKGTDFLEKAFELTPLSNFLMLTAHPELDLVIEALNNGNICKFLIKPWQAEEFSEIIELILLDRKKELAQIKAEGSSLTMEESFELEMQNMRNKMKVQIQMLIHKLLELHKANYATERNLWDTIKIFFGLIKEKSPLVGDHSTRVSKLARNFAIFIQLPQKYIVDIEISALLHDIGKVALPESIVSRIGQPLRKDEEELLNLHPLNGQYAFYNIKPLKRVGQYIRLHHERWDGAGFPDGLRENEIPLGVQILQVCNAFDNLRQADSKLHSSQQRQALSALKARAGKSLSPGITAKFIMFINELKRMSEIERIETKEPYDIEDLIEMAIMQITDEDDRISYNDVVLVRSFKPTPLALVKPKLIKNMLVNLLRNALEAIQDKGTITISLSSVDSNFMVEIEDTGNGIPEKSIHRVVEEGYTTKIDKEKHMGIGLYEVKKTVSYHKGSFKIESVHKKGTTVRINLPLK